MITRKTDVVPIPEADGTSWEIPILGLAR